MVEYHEILKLSPNPTKEEIRKAYRKFAFHFHPDRNKEHGDLFLFIREAYEALMRMADAPPPPPKPKPTADVSHYQPSKAHGPKVKPGKANHNLAFVTARLKKVRLQPNMYVIRNEPKVKDKERQCGTCDGYGFYENIRHQLKRCPKCRGTGLRVDLEKDDG